MSDSRVCRDIVRESLQLRFPRHVSSRPLAAAASHAQLSTGYEPGPPPDSPRLPSARIELPTTTEWRFPRKPSGFGSPREPLRRAEPRHACSGACGSVRANARQNPRLHLGRVHEQAPPRPCSSLPSPGPPTTSGSSMSLSPQESSPTLRASLRRCRKRRSKGAMSADGGYRFSSRAGVGALARRTYPRAVPPSRSGSRRVPQGERGHGRGRTILCSSVPHRPPSESVIDSIDPVDLARTPAQDVPKERVSGFGRVLGSERSLDLKPVIVVQVLLPFVGQSHQEPVLDFLALRQRAGLSRSLLNFGWRTPGLLYEVIYVTPRQQPRRRAEPARPGHRPGAADRGSPGPAGSASPPPPARSPPSVESSGHHASA